MGVQVTSPSDVLMVYPNPACNQVFITGAKAGASVDLRDLNGRLLLHQDASAPLPLKTIAPGIYLLQVGEKVLRIQVAGE